MPLELTTRPWTRAEAMMFRDAATEFSSGVPRRKREQLEQVLRMGRSLGQLAWQAWWNGLSGEQQEVVVRATAKLPARCRLILVNGRIDDPWVAAAVGFVTPLLDLVELDHVLNDNETFEQEHDDAAA
jgi:hypothetical protein